ncbi:MAG: hypothetical protein ACJAZX_001392 [Rickettsiales bacterium]|jgi:hypothetical protein
MDCRVRAKALYRNDGVFSLFVKFPTSSLRAAGAAIHTKLKHQKNPIKNQ